MKFSIITPNRDGEKFLEKSIDSIHNQKSDNIDIEHIVVDGLSKDRSGDIFASRTGDIDNLIIEKDTGPANAINKGAGKATGDIVTWLGSDDIYFPGTFKKVRETFLKNPDCAFCFGNCIIINEHGDEIRGGITRFKKTFFPLSSRFTFQCINYISQPAVFVRRSAWLEAGPLREDMVAAWDYEFFLRLWQIGPGVLVAGVPLSAFRWHQSSISGQLFHIQFKEEYDEARKDAGTFSIQTLIHFFVRWGIVGIYELMTRLNRIGSKV